MSRSAVTLAISVMAIASAATPIALAVDGSPTFMSTSECVDGVLVITTSGSGYDATGTNHIRIELTSGGRHELFDEDFADSFHVVQRTGQWPSGGSGSTDLDTWNGEHEVHSAGTFGPGACPRPSVAPSPTPSPTPRVVLQGPCDGSRYRWRYVAPGGATALLIRAKVVSQGWRRFALLARPEVKTSRYRRLVVGSRVTARTYEGTPLLSRTVESRPRRACPK